PTATPTPMPTATPTQAPTATPTPAPTPTPTTGLDAERQAIADRVLELCNIERAAAGVPPLVASSPLDLVATFRSEDMATRNYFSHTDPDGNSPFYHIQQAGISYRTAGENIAYGYRTPEDVVEGWMTSEGHRKNILSASFGKLGVGYALNSDGRPYWTQLFTD
ncbi:MAG: CAP domain-containing protein, partial [Candidatus Sericytochromatia bacterium]